MKKLITLSLLLAFVFFVGYRIYQDSAGTTEKSTENIQALSKYGSRGTETKNIQQKLKNLGYYTGDVDGIFGSKTLAAVKSFQKAWGLQVDGIVGQATLKALGLQSSSSSNTSYNNNVNLLARIISAEARGEPYVGQVAVGAVILNRVEHPSFPNSIAGVVYQNGAFTAIVDGQINEAVADSAYKAARDCLNGWDPTGGCIYYYNPQTAVNQWIRTLPVTTTIGKHVFSVGK